MLDHGTGKQIAGQFGISPRTVEAHRANLMARLDVRTASQAIQLAIEGEAYAAPAALHVQAFDRSRDARIALPTLQ